MLPDKKELDVSRSKRKPPGIAPAPRPFEIDGKPASASARQGLWWETREARAAETREEMEGHLEALSPDARRYARLFFEPGSERTVPESTRQARMRRLANTPEEVWTVGEEDTVIYSGPAPDAGSRESV